MFNFPKRPPSYTKRQVSVIGMSDHGCSFAISLIARNCATHLVLVDQSFQKAKGEALDLLDSLPFLPDINLSYSSDVRATANSDVVVLTLGKPFNLEFNTRMGLLDRNTKLVANAAFWAAKFSPDATIIVGTDPMDVMTFIAAQSARHSTPHFPRHRVIGVGTALDIARMRAVIAKHTGIGARDVVANIVGEHGNHMIPLWRHFRIRGMPLEDVCPELTTKNARAELRQQVQDACYRIVEAKPEGTSRGIGECLADLTQSLLMGIGNVRTVCTSVSPEEFAGLKETVYMSVPCKIGPDGVESIFPFDVTSEERSQIMEAADILLEAQERALGVLGDLEDESDGVGQYGWSAKSPASLVQE